MHSDQRAIRCGDESAKEHLAARHARTRGRICDHIKGEQNKSHARHRQKGSSERSAESQVAKHSLQEKAAYPSNCNADSLGELNIQKATAHDNDGGDRKSVV